MFGSTIDAFQHVIFSEARYSANIVSIVLAAPPEEETTREKFPYKSSKRIENGLCLFSPHPTFPFPNLLFLTLSLLSFLLETIL